MERDAAARPGSGPRGPRPERRPVPIPARIVGRLRRRGTLTPLGAGVVITVPPLLAGLAEWGLRGGPGVLFELAFLAACVTGALHVRRADLLAAPVSAPIGFTVVLLVTGLGQGGLTDQVLRLTTALARTAPWLFAGTVLTALVIGARFLLTRGARRPGPKARQKD